ncbi:hypothetical protein H310_03477 [Aphanomyces invadans]|uniref:RCC1-like domain-containing protein n=1 Tax=Aphanomyces invadans TaxID=157072 RepID=A0A024UJJ6_9STRA|nr:hypothetical protein H310_03477 [Aphanomyces invadans]ETW05793.1 hypothetical protein H310_03477 [Aphanomyces invadans]|eukprot:XP_008865570.1 hypothetical protein H310_03477 [Aphanomyces invadans]
MEITLLTTSQYVDDRYKELKRKRPDEKELDAVVEDTSAAAAALNGLPPAARRFDALHMSAETTAVFGSSEMMEKRKLTGVLYDLEMMWPMTLLDKKLTLVYTILNQMAATETTTRDPSATAVDEKKYMAATSTTTLESLPLATQLAVKLFFRLIQSIRTRSEATGNYAMLLRLVHQLPRMLTDIPPLALSPEQRLLTDDKSIFDEIVTTVQQVVAVSKDDQEAVLATLLGLSIKRGRLLHILGVVRLLMQADPALPMHLALPFLQELADAKAQETEHVPDEGLHNGYVMSFGKGDHGKLGHGTCTHTTCADSKCTENKTVPTMLDAIRDVMFKKIDSLSTHSVAITVTGELYTWGNGEKFRLGHGDATKEYTPRLVEAFSDKPRVKDVACGLGHTVVLLVTGDVYAWGNGGNGRLGLGDTVDQSAPMKVSFVEAKTDTWSMGAVFCGASHTLAITTQGRLYTWGKNNQGQCGHGHTNDQLTPAEVLYFDEMELKVATVAGGWEHTLICTTGGQAFACGCGYKDSRRAGLPPVLGVGMNDTDRRVKPALIPVLENCVGVACGWDHSLAVTGDGSVYSWGSGSNGKLGHGDEDNRDIPTKIQGLHGKVIQDVKAGCEHTTAITSTGEMYTWGHSDSGRLGHGDNVTRKTPCFVESFAWQGYRPVAIAVGDKYNLVLVQPVAEKAANTNNQVAITKPPVTPRTGHVYPSLDESMPLNASSVTSHMMVQLDRLASAYMPQDNAQLLDKLRQLYLHPTASVPTMAYAIDVSNETFQTLVEIVSSTIAKPDPIDTAAKSLKQTSKVSTQTSLILTSLRLIQVNLFHLLSCSSTQLSPLVLQNLYAMLRELATLPASEDTHEISQCAADALKIGFQLFYPTGVEQHELLWRLMHMTHSSDLILLRALVDRLRQDYVVVELMSRLFSKQHKCALDTPPNEYSWDKDNLTSLDLLALMTRLLKQCAEVDNENPRLQLQLKMLAVLQSHLFSAWSSSYCTTCISNTLGPYLECLFGEALSLLRKVHKGLLKGNDLSKLQPSFFHVLVPLAIECIEVTHLRSNIKVGKALLPLLLPILKLLDEVTYKISEDSKVNNQILPDIEWITELENVCARTVGRYVCVFLASSAATAESAATPSCLQYLCRHGTMKSDPHEELLRKWEASHVYDVAHETQPPDHVPSDVTLVDHLAILDWVQGQGVLHDFHNYMLCHLEPTPATTEVIPLVIVVWHTGLLPSIFACIAAIGTVNLRESSANHPPPPEALLHVWKWVLTYCAGLDTAPWECIRSQGMVLLEYYPSKCLFSSDHSPTM